MEDRTFTVNIQRADNGFFIVSYEMWEYDNTKEVSEHYRMTLVSETFEDAYGRIGDAIAKRFGISEEE